MIIENMYNIIFEASNINPSVGDVITLTITAKDYNGIVISSKELTVKCNIGTFSNSSQSYTGTTNESGQIIIQYNCTGFGMCKISVGPFVDYININNPYPVGSIYMSILSTNPGTLFGGTWTQLKDRFLLGAGDTYNNGDTDGFASITLTANQSGIRGHTHGMQHTHNHNHQVGSKEWSTGSGNSWGRMTTSNRSVGYKYTDYDATNGSRANTEANASGDAIEAHSNMPPYLVVYMWRRVS